MKKLEDLCQKLAIPKYLLVDYSDNNNTENVVGMQKLLSHPYVINSLNRIKNENGNKLYCQFIEELFEGLYAFRKLDQLDLLKDFEEGYSTLIGFIRDNQVRTKGSDRIRTLIKEKIKSYSQELDNYKIGCILKGSAFYGDSNHKSDADIQFVTDTLTDEKKNLISKIKLDLEDTGQDLRVEVSNTYDFSGINKKLKNIIEGDIKDMTTYYLSEQQRNVIRGPASYIHLFLSEPIHKYKDMTNNLNETRTLLRLAIEKDPILHFLVALDIAETIQCRKEKLQYY